MPMILSAAELERDSGFIKVRKSFVVVCRRILPLISKEAINTAPVILARNLAAQQIIESQHGLGWKGP